MFSLEFTPVKFQHWYGQNLNFVETEYLAERGIPLEEERGCSDCEGRGYHECDMGHSHDCDTCEGEGKLLKTSDEVLQEYGRTLYNAQVKIDRERVVKFLKEQEDASKQPTVGLRSN